MIDFTAHTCCTYKSEQASQGIALRCLFVCLVALIACLLMLVPKAFADDNVSVSVQCPATAAGQYAQATASAVGFAEDAQVVYTWFYSADGGTTWAVASKGLSSTYNIEVNETTTAYGWKVQAQANDVACECTFSVALTHVGETFSVSYDNAAEQTSGSITFTITADCADGAAGKVMVTDATAYVASENSPALVLGEVQDAATDYVYDVEGVDRYAFYGNANLYEIVFERDLTGVSTKAADEDQAAIGARAFYKCTNLRSVRFECSRIDGIGNNAFSHCTAMTRLDFADDAQFVSKGICHGAFLDCSSLTTLSIPPIMCCTRRGDYYETYGSTTGNWPTGYQSYWHNNNYCVETEAIAANAFKGCTSLTSITFKAGNTYGMFAYWKSAGCGLRALTSLETVIYEAAQPYFGNQDGSIANGGVVSVWGDYYDEDEGWITGSTPTFYYAVDYYYTADAASADDAFKENRIARVEYANGTDVSAIQAGDAAALESAMPDRALYAQTDADGVVPDPNAAAQAACAAGVEGFEDAAEHTWVWYLQAGQSRRSGLADSCNAYLVKADSLEAGRLEADAQGANQIEALYRACTQNLSRGSVQNTLFDIERYYKYVADSQFYQFDQQLTKKQREKRLLTNLLNMTNPENSAATMTPWFTLDGGGLMTLAAQMTLYDGAGNALDLTDTDKFTITYERYVDGAYEVVDTSSAEVESGPLLMTITPTAASGYDTNTCLKEWVFVNGRNGLIIERYSTSSSTTWRNAIWANGSNSIPREKFSNASGTFAVGVSSSDAASALLGAAYAGLCAGPINVLSDESTYGFALALGDKNSFNTQGEITDTSSLETFSRGDDMPSEQADAAYRGFERSKASMGLSGCTWAQTALLVNPNYLQDSAAAAASFAYTQGAAIFYTEADGTLSADTLAYLEQFENVLAVGDETMISQDALAAVPSTVNVSRVEGQASAEEGTAVAPGNACALSIAMAEYLLQSDYGVSASSVAIVVADGSDIVNDAVGCQNFSGHENGITLVVASSADAKAVAGYLRTYANQVKNIRLFGRSGAAANSSAFTFYSASGEDETGALAETWEVDPSAIAAPCAGDTYELYGVLFSVEEGLQLSQLSRLWGTEAVEEGEYVGRASDGQAVTYTLTGSIEPTVTRVTKPVANTGLVYTGAQQVGVASGEGYTVTDGEATAAGTYTAVVTLKEGYAWQDGSTGDLSLRWDIAKASLTGGSVRADSFTKTYTGQVAAPEIYEVVLANGDVLPAQDYTITYYKDSVADGNEIARDGMVAAGTYYVVVTGTNNCTGGLTVSFVIKPQSSSPSSGGSSHTSSSGGSAAAKSAGSTNSNSSSSNNTSSAGSGSNNMNSADESNEAEAQDGNTFYKDGWLYVKAPGNPAGYVFGQTASVESFSLFSPLGLFDLLLLLICIGAVGGAIFFATRSRKETDDLIDAQIDPGAYEFGSGAEMATSQVGAQQ